VDWIDLAQDTDKWRAVANTVMNLSHPGNFLTRWGTVSVLRTVLQHGVMPVLVRFVTGSGTWVMHVVQRSYE
jgi:hypothetical protein